MTREDEESVLSRWSRRKLETKQAAPQQTALLETGDEREMPESVTPEAEPPLTDADMPPLESLDENSDFSAFMSEGVSDELRNLALRKLFRAPVFNIRDGLDEYDEDYTYFEKLGDIVTCDMKHQVEMKELRRREAEEQAAAEADSIEEFDETEEMDELETVDDGDHELEAVDESDHQARDEITAAAETEPRAEEKTDE